MSRIQRIFKQQLTQKLIDDVKSGVDRLYIGAAKVTPWAIESSPSVEAEAPSEITIDVQNELIFAKKVLGDEISPVVRRVDWVSNTVYSEYDDRDPSLPDRNFYVLNASTNDVYKCISNNKGAPSTQLPNFPDVKGTNVTTGDGYVWMYMFNIDTTSNTKFTTDKFIPVVIDQEAVDAATPGAINAIKMVAGGSGYVTASGIIEIPSELRQADGSALGAKLLGTGLANTSGVFDNCSLFVSDANTSSAVIAVPITTPTTGYKSNSSGTFVLFSEPQGANNVGFPLANGQPFVLSPRIIVSSLNRTSGNNFVGYTVVNSNTGGISAVEVVHAGDSYTSAEVTIVAAPGFGSGAQARAVLSPRGGHGSDPVAELYCKDFAVHTVFSNNSAEGLATNVTYRQLVLLSNPEFVQTTALGIANSNVDLVLNVPNLGVEFTVGTDVDVGNSSSNTTGTIVYVQEPFVYLDTDSPFVVNTAIHRLILQSDDTVNNAIVGVSTTFGFQKDQDVSVFRIEGLSHANVDASTILSAAASNSTFATVTVANTVLDVANTTSPIQYYLGLRDSYESDLYGVFAPILNRIGPDTFVFDGTYQLALNTAANFVAGDIVKTGISDRRGIVAAFDANTKVMTLVGVNNSVDLVDTSEDDTAESITTLDNTKVASIDEVLKSPTGRYNTGDVLYIRNIEAVERDPESQERIKITIKT